MQCAIRFTHSISWTNQYAGPIYDFISHIEIFQTIYFGNETEEKGCCAFAQGQPPTIAAGGRRRSTAAVAGTASHKT